MSCAFIWKNNIYKMATKLHPDCMTAHILMIDCSCEEARPLLDFTLSPGGILELFRWRPQPPARCNCSFPSTKEDEQLWRGLVSLSGIEGLCEYFKGQDSCKGFAF